MKNIRVLLAISLLLSGIFVATHIWAAATPPRATKSPKAKKTDTVVADATQTLVQGRGIFRFDTFGDEAFWGDALRLHDAIQGAAFGGVGPGVSPRAALQLGLKVDSDALPKTMVKQLRQGRVDLDSPATTLALLKADSVVGVK